MIRKFTYLILNIFLVLSLSGAAILPAAARSESPPPAPLSYSDVADLVTGASLVLKGKVRGVRKVQTGAGDTSGTVQNYLLVTADVTSLIRGDNGIAPRIGFLALPAEGSKAASPFRARQMVMLFARPGTKPDQIQLVSRNAAQPWSAELEALARGIVAETLKPGAAPAVIAVGDAFHVEGTVAGESETQFFLKTASGAPISLAVVHRPGEPVKWGASIGEIIDESAVPPAKDTLLWYRLACALPASLPETATRNLSPGDATATIADYRVVLESLGSCGRTL